MSVQSEVSVSGIKANLSWLDRLAWLAMVFFAAATASKVLNLATINFLGLSFEPRFTIVVFVILTVCHAFVAVHLVKSFGKGRDRIAAVDRERFYLEQLSGGGLLIRGTSDYRDSFVELPEERGTVQLRTQIMDPAVWVHLLLPIIAVIACVPFELSWSAAFLLCLSASIARVNFSIGAAWFIALADFGRTDENSLYFTKNNEQIRLKAYGSSYPVPQVLNFQVSQREYFLHLIADVARFMALPILVLGIVWLIASAIRQVILFF